MEVGLVVLNRPQKLNAFAGEMRDRIGDAIETLGADSAVRAIVITGEGRGFCAGADIDYLNELVAEENARDFQRLLEAGERVVQEIRTVEKPVIAAINGPAAGGGANLALADAVVAQVEENFCVDKNRIFATGWSYGGSMSYRTACSRPLGGTASWGVRGVAVYSGAQLSGTCTPSKSVAYYGSHGTGDNVLGYDGGVGLAQNFAKANGCTWATPTKVTSGNHVCTNMTGCGAGYPVDFCSFNGPHTPDPKDPNQNTSWQYQLVWNFFNQF